MNLTLELNPRDGFTAALEPFASPQLARRDLIVAKLDHQFVAFCVVWQLDENSDQWLVYLDEKIPQPELGTKLLDAARRWAFEQGGTNLRSAQALDESELRSEIFLSAGFEIQATLHAFEVDYLNLSDIYTPLLDRLRDRGKIPDSAQIVELNDLSMNAARELLRRQVLQSRGRLYDLDQGRNFSPGLSFGIKDGSQLVAVTLGTSHGKDQAAEIHWSAVDESYRAGWAFVMMESEILHRCQEHANGKSHYLTNPELDPGMLKLSKNTHATLRGKRLIFSAAKPASS